MTNIIHKNTLIITKGRFLDKSEPDCAKALIAAMSGQLGLGENPNFHHSDVIQYHDMTLNDRNVGFVFSDFDSNYMYVQINSIKDIMCLLANSRPMLAHLSNAGSEYPYKDIRLEDPSLTFYTMVWKLLFGNWSNYLFGEHAVTFNSNQKIDAAAAQRVASHNIMELKVAVAYANRYKITTNEAMSIVGSNNMRTTIDYGLINIRDCYAIADDIHTLHASEIPRVKGRLGERAKICIDNHGFVVVEENDREGYRATRYFKRGDTNGEILEYSDRDGSTKSVVCEYLIKNQGQCLQAETDEEMLSVIRAERQKMKRLMRARA